MNPLWRRENANEPFGDLSPDERDKGERLVRLGDRVLKTFVGSAESYAKVGPDGRALNAADAAELRGALVRLARCGRHIADERDLVEQGTGSEVDLRSSRDFIRSLRHSVVLALSDDPAERALAMSVDETKARGQPVYEDWGTIMGRP
jgi:hypothetical protein